jgi:hypothetical protein
MAGDAFIELEKPLHLITPLGLAEAWFIIPAGADGIEWGCFQKDTGEFWVWPNKQIRLHHSITEYRYTVSDIMLTPEAEARLIPHRARAAALKKRNNSHEP